MNKVLLHCRPGFEKECAAEIQDLAAELEVFGFPRVINNSGFVIFEGYGPEDGRILMEQLSFNQLVFARSWFMVLAELKDMDTEDRISAVMEHSELLPKAGMLWVESGEGDEYRSLLSFCRKFTVPLRQAMRSSGVLTKKEHDKMPRIHLFLTDSGNGYLGYSRSDNGSPFYMGIERLKFPSDAPSRSTLKLDEAFSVFLTKEEQEERAHSGMKAVDLGACPGGWTYQLVRRGMFVEAIDNGEMAPSLMETGQVKHYSVDGFKHEPIHTNNRWLICDMVEKPDRVASLMARWFINGWCHDAIFNLKLPMKQRYTMVSDCLNQLSSALRHAGVRHEIKAKHLYHDREEITVYVHRRK
ncbi:23S rRNA (cytidine(2498)-2'-O)-methyltransferase RlmM [Ferrimonas lipolytica]|uniref:Ribosomal RNA large subunit methyltransferase M n=1 Tax=Ferrimonas lipolytica TaxID=2724191 RepID=A0A6H1UFE4_9GAMM|nr:23S rRNA (cytidine(2498)-2'-O)-methyltransferase RlmM [Ferrimonas lipolytica]QIZ77053.1 23S rRNA (cytidine(2498)-2'-O)-methyltransferase RlmM [Ferrimonas lipolytica]